MKFFTRKQFLPIPRKFYTPSLFEVQDITNLVKNSCENSISSTQSFNLSQQILKNSIANSTYQNIKSRNLSIDSNTSETIPTLKSLNFERKKRKLHKLSARQQPINTDNKENENNTIYNKKENDYLLHQWKAPEPNFLSKYNNKISKLFEIKNKYQTQQFQQIADRRESNINKILNEKIKKLVEQKKQMMNKNKK